MAGYGPSLGPPSTLRRYPSFTCCHAVSAQGQLSYCEVVAGEGVSSSCDQVLEQQAAGRWLRRLVHTLGHMDLMNGET